MIVQSHHTRMTVLGSGDTVWLTPNTITIILSGIIRIRDKLSSKTSNVIKAQKRKI